MESVESAMQIIPTAPFWLDPQFDLISLAPKDVCGSKNLFESGVFDKNPFSHSDGEQPQSTVKAWYVMLE